MRRPTFRQLQIFNSVAKHLSFTRAAEELFLTQSTVSSQMKDLTEAIGSQLVEVVGKKIFLTPLGERLQALYNTFDAEWEKFEYELLESKQLKFGSLKLTAINTAQYFMPRILGQFSNLHPELSVSLKVTNRQDVVSRIFDNIDDLYILGSLPDDIELKAVPLSDNPLVVVAHPNHPLAKKKNIPLKQFEKESFITREVGSGTRKMVDAFFLENKIKVKPRIELGGNEAIKQGIMGGFGISILSAYTIRSEIQAGNLVVLNFEKFPMLKTWYIAYLASKQLSPAARAFLDYTKEIGRGLIRVEEFFDNEFEEVVPA